MVVGEAIICICQNQNTFFHSITSWREITTLPDGDYETLSGYLIEQLGRLPEEQEHPIIEDEKLTYKIEHVEDRRIKWVKVCKNQPAVPEKEEKEK